MSEILVKGTGAANSDEFTVSVGNPQTVSIYPEANFGADIGILMKKNADETFDQVFLDGAVVEIGATNPQVLVVGLGVYRLEFAARTAAIGAFADRYDR